MANESAPPSPPTLAGSVSNVVDAFRTAPVLLMIVLLNGFFAGAAGYYLLQVEHYRADDRKALAQLLGDCVTKTVPVDYLQRKSSP